MLLIIKFRHKVYIDEKTSVIHEQHKEYGNFREPIITNNNNAITIIEEPTCKKIKIQNI
jgi:hypothetical protein